MTRARGIGVAILALGLSVGCSAIVSRTTGRLSASIAGALQANDDPETVRQAAPAYLVLIDGLIADAPDDGTLLQAGADLYSSYASAFVRDKARSQRLAHRARDYGFRAMCAVDSAMCGVWSRPYPEFEDAVDGVDRDDVDALYSAAGAWATWIKANSADWSAVADKARVEAMIRRIVALDPTYRNGGPYLYLGVLATLIPEGLGGKPEEGRVAFERAIELSEGRNLMAKVLLARDYARLVFDRGLHDRLCREVLDAAVEEPGLTLTNALAQEEAAALLASSEDWFGE